MCGSVWVDVCECNYIPSNIGPTTVTTTDTIRFCSVGRPFAGVDIKIDEPDEDGTGEVRGLKFIVQYPLEIKLSLHV